MSAITGILCQLITGNVSGAGTDGDIYVGIGGREFYIDSSADDFERGSWREYILGRAPLEPNLPSPQVRILNSTNNDPRVGFPLDTIDLAKSPVYVRFEPQGSSPDWNLSWATVLVYRGEGSFVGAWMPPTDFDNLWLGIGASGGEDLSTSRTSGASTSRLSSIRSTWWPSGQASRLSSAVKCLRRLVSAARPNGVSATET